MKNKFALFGLLGLVGLAGFWLKSVPLAGLVLLFLLFFTAGVRPGQEFRTMVALSGKRAFAAGAISAGLIYLLTAVITLSPRIVNIVNFEIELVLLVLLLMGCYLLSLLVFVVEVLVGCRALLKQQKGEQHANDA